MKISSLFLKNFRNIVEKDFHFNTQFTVIIGKNGRGKSTLLHALRVAAGAYFLGIPEVKRRHIQNGEIRVTNTNIMLEHRPVVVKATGIVGEENITWQRRILNESNITTTSISDIGKVKAISQTKYKRMQEEQTDQLDLPVIAYFGTDRVHGVGRNNSNVGKSQRVGRQIYKEGYHNWYNMRSSTYQYTKWLQTYDVLNVTGRGYNGNKNLFLETVKTSCPLIEHIQFVGQELWLSVTLNGTTSDLLPLTLHSDGIITYVEMVAELAYRVLVLNGYKQASAMEETSGIVLIDEIDIHLHPSWQRHVVHDLKTAFPNLQFIVTTHSPFIVQSLMNTELLNLDLTEDYSGVENDPMRYSLEEIAVKEMHVGESLENVERSHEFLEMQKAAAEFFELVEQANNPEAIELARAKLDQLSIRFSHDPIFVAQMTTELPPNA